MRRDQAHCHPCAWCRAPIDCDGELERNHDGEPPVICRSYHLPNGCVEFLLCAICAAEAAR